MSQVIFDVIDPSTTSGNQLAQILNDFKDALVSGCIGTSRPSQLDAGGMWVDSSLQISNSTWDVKIYTGTVDITVFRINLTTGVPSISSSDNTFEITRISADSVGPLLKMIKKRVANNGQNLVGDILGEVQFLGATDSLSTPVSARIKVVATDDFVTAQTGGYMAFEVTSTDTNTISEFMRIIDGKLAIGLTAATEKLHIRGNIKSERVLDDANPVKKILKKARVSGNGQVLNADSVSESISTAVDQNGAEVELFKIETVATENITDVANGNKVSFKNKKIGTIVYQTLLELGEYLSLGKISTSSLVVNAGKTQAAANAAFAGVEVETSDQGSFRVAFDSTLASKFKIGVAGSEKEIINTDSAQNVSNKAIISPSRLSVKSDTEANLTTYAATATNGQWCFASDTKTMYQVIDNALVPAGSGGGGSSLVWEKTGTLSPTGSAVDGFNLEDFSYFDVQEVYATFVVPTSYRSGKQITLVGASFFCAGNSGNVLFRADCALLKPGTTILGTYPNIRTTTNTENTLTVANRLENVGTLDITSSIGEINGVAVAAGDKLRIRLYRNVTSETSSAQFDARMLLNAIEVKLS